MKRDRVYIVGGGQAGLALAYALRQQGVPFCILDAAQRTGDSWRERYDSLVLFTPSQYSSLPGYRLELPVDTYPTKEQVADYLERYAQRYAFPIEHGVRVRRLTSDGGDLVLHTNRGVIAVAKVAVATGALQSPWIPGFAAQLGPRVQQIHSATYRNPSQVGPGAVVVVGAGNSGAQIAAELSAERLVHIAYGRLPKRLPQRFLGRDIFWWLLRAGVLDRPTTTTDFGLSGIPLIGTNLKKRLRCGALQRQNRAVDARPGELLFADDSTMAVDTVIWATGFQNDFGWIEVPGATLDGKPIQHAGRSPRRGLYFIGLPGLCTKGSAFLGFVGRDALALAAAIAADRND